MHAKICRLVLLKYDIEDVKKYFFLFKESLGKNNNTTVTQRFVHAIMGIIIRLDD